MVIGYERAYHGRAAGVRTYGLVCMASTALTVFVGYADYWFGGAGSPSAPDPTRIVQGIVTGCSILCAGVIIKDGLSINGLTTAASLWTAAATGILIGVGFYAAALALALLCLLAMTLGQNIQKRLPGRLLHPGPQRSSDNRAVYIHIARQAPRRLPARTRS